MSLWLSSTALMRPSVPDWLEELCQRLAANDQTITTVEITHQRIDDNSARILAKAFEENTNVTVLMISFYNIVDDGAYYIGSVLSNQNCRIKKLQIRDLRNAREFRTLFTALQKNTTIEELSLRHCAICAQSAKTLGEYMSIAHTNYSTTPTLQELRLVDTQIVGNGLESIICAQQQQQDLNNNNTGRCRQSSLKRLYFVNNDLDHLDANCLKMMLLQSNQNQTLALEELYLCENQISDEGTLALCRGLKENSTIRKLDLRSNGIAVDGALGLQEIVKTSKSLICLNLPNNELGNLGTDALARGLCSGGCVLEKLDLGENGIDSTGAKSIASMLRTNRSIQDLNLAFNSIGDDGAAAIASVLVSNTTVLSLSLKRNNISNLGAVAFATKLPKMRGLKELIMTKNSIDPEGAACLLHGLKSNMDLEYLHVEEKVSEPILKEIVHWIRLNKAGRRIFRGSSIPLTLWPNVLSRISSDMDAIFHFLSEKPDVFSGPQSSS